MNKSCSFAVYSDMETIPFKAGDKVVISIKGVWTNEDWEEIIEVTTPKMITEITAVEDGTVIFGNLDMEILPPDDTHTVMDELKVSTFVPLNDEYKVNMTDNGSINMGKSATGTKSIAFNKGESKGTDSVSANNGKANGSISAAFNYGTANASRSLAVNSGKCYGDSSAALNLSECFNPYSATTGYSCKAYGRVLKCVSFNPTEKTLTLEDGQSTSGLVGKNITMRCYNIINTLMYTKAAVTSVSGSVLHFDNAEFNTDADYSAKLLPGNIAFVEDSSMSYGLGNMTGGSNTISAARYSLADGLQVCALNDASAIFGKYGISDFDAGLFLANGTSAKAPGLAFKALSDGSVHADGEYTSPCADYAEFFEWKDGNPDKEDRAGYFVKLNGDKIEICDNQDDVIGIVSATPAIVGDSGELHWHNKYVTDDFGRIQYHDVVIPEEKDEEGNIITEEHTETQPVINPDWDAYEEYIPRKERPEWATVGVLGKLIVYDDGTLKGGDKCKCGEGGVAIKAEQGGYRVLKRIADDKVLIWMK